MDKEEKDALGLYTLKEAAEYIDVSMMTIENWVSKGLIKQTQVRRANGSLGARSYYLRDELLAAKKNVYRKHRKHDGQELEKI